jgi:dihydroflavonol-4-reductase
MKAFVTGATGLLGSNLVRLLTAQGHDVKALVRSKEKAQKLLGDSGAELVIGDMEDVDGFKHELIGIDALFHTAAYFREYYGLGDHWPKLERINIHGTIQLLEAAEHLGVKKAIYVSSSTVIGETASGISDENAAPDGFAEINLYAKSKVLAEKAVYDFIDSHQMPVVLILPSVMFGPQDAAPTAIGGIIVNILKRNLPGIPPGGMNVVDARDVAQAMINAVERGKSGERYLLTRQYVEMSDFAKTVATIGGVPAPRNLPYLFVLAFAWMQERMASITGREPTASVSGVRVLRKRYLISGSKAERELGTVYRPLEQTLHDEVEWFIDHGYVTPAAPTAPRQPANSLAS